MGLTPWERAFLAALEHSGPLSAPGGMIEAGRDRMNDEPVRIVHKNPVGPTRNGWGSRTDTRVGSKKLRKGNRHDGEGNARRESDPRG